ncbi:MAG TPA: hypothetical protein VIC70_00160 [Gaiellaceae bacterium]|jgi:hypothetical protein
MRSLSLIALLALVFAAGCGGGGGRSQSGSHTYVVVPPAKSGVSGIYVTIVSPVAIPASLLTKGGARIVGHAKGPQKCSYTKKAEGLQGQLADLNGKTVTLNVNGTNSFVSLVCSTLKTAAFNPALLASA